jgi:predicted DNA-binding transcriptional regulator AlpA
VKVEFAHLVTGADIARRLGVSRERVSQLAERDDFPEPLGRIGGSLVWNGPDVDAWAERWRDEAPPRGPRPRTATT